MAIAYRVVLGRPMLLVSGAVQLSTPSLLKT